MELLDVKKQRRVDNINRLSPAAAAAAALSALAPAADRANANATANFDI